MIVFPMFPTNIKSFDFDTKTEVEESISGNEQRFSYRSKGRRRFKIILDAVPTQGTAPSVFDTEYRIGSQFYNLTTITKFFEEEVRGKAINFYLKQKPPIFPTDIYMRFDDDALQVKILNKNFCYVEAVVIEC